MEEKQEKRGGKRENAGRKKKDGKKILLLLELDLCNAIQDIHNKTEFINNAVRFALSNKAVFEKYVEQLEEKK